MIIVELAVRCKTCKTELTALISAEVSGGPQEILVEPCEKCVDNAAEVKTALDSSARRDDPPEDDEVKIDLVVNRDRQVISVTDRAKY